MMPHNAKAAEFVRSALGDLKFDLAIILGSGLGPLTEQLEGAFSLSYSEIPGFSATHVSGHGGRLWSGNLNGWQLLVFQGRFHLYEGYRAAEVVRPVQLAADLGCRRLLLTNAAGGISEDFRPGDFMFIRDHLNLTGDNPLRGNSDNPFVDLSRLYTRELFHPLSEEVQSSDIRLHEGVLAALSGPSYETPAEVRMVKLLGGDAVSMSTVPEAIMAKYLGLEIAGISLIANLAAGIAQETLSHNDVLASGYRSADRFCLLVRILIKCWRTLPRT